jgi:hypothetical protein
VHNALRDRLVRSLVIGVTDWEGNRAPMALPDPQPEFFFVPTYAADRAKALGPDVLNARLGAATHGFYAASSKYLTPQTARGKAAIAAAWIDTLDAKVPPSKGLVLSF